jgi:hypothetical protein
MRKKQSVKKKEKRQNGILPWEPNTEVFRKEEVTGLHQMPLLEVGAWG